jgi:pre-mRNA-splicing factor SYF1
MKLANTQTILNFCEYLENNDYFEETFRVYEQAINYFTWPYVYDIWIIYLTKFVQRYRGGKIERARDLFEQVISSCTKDVRFIYLLFRKLKYFTTCMLTWKRNMAY